MKRDAHARAKLHAVYWDLDEYDCTAESRAIARQDTVHLHFVNELDACRALLAYRDECRASILATGHYPDPRYRCIRGPGGLIRAVEVGGKTISHLWGDNE